MLKRAVWIVALLAPSIAAAGPRHPAARKPAPVATAATADQALARVQAFYAGVQHASTTFRQEVRNVTFGRSDVSSGRLYLARPGKMRWDYRAKTKKPRAPLARSFISNGRDLYLVDNENQQVFQKDLQKDLMPTAVSFLYGKGDLRAEFTPTLDASHAYGAASDVVLSLTPKAPSTQYQRLVLVVDPTSYEVKESILVDAAGNTNRFQFAAANVKAPIEDRFFEFDPSSVPTYRIITP